MNNSITARIAHNIGSFEKPGNVFGFAEKRELPVKRVLENSVRKNETVSRLLDRFETVAEYNFQPGIKHDLHGYSPSIYRFVRDKVTDALYLIRKYGDPIIKNPDDKWMFKPHTQVSTMTIQHVDPGHFSEYLDIYRVPKNAEIFEDSFKYTTPYAQRRLFVSTSQNSKDHIWEHIKEYRKP